MYADVSITNTLRRCFGIEKIRGITKKSQVDFRPTTFSYENVVQFQFSYVSLHPARYPEYAVHSCIVIYYNKNMSFKILYDLLDINVYVILYYYISSFY